ncbi:hypothetical protein C8T65DRAFT_750100 [Cerioporus squamosus]|nr:hypothetical protein C8T65DRAFT_750100 [Cerioporus squamosus]
MSTTPVDWLLDASALEKKLTSLGLPPRRLALIDALQELAQESARMACFLAGPSPDDALDYDIVEEEIYKGMQAFQATMVKVLNWKDYGDVKQEPLSPWFGPVSSPSPVSTPVSTPISSRESSPVDSDGGSDHFALYAPDSPKSDAGYVSDEDYDLLSPHLDALPDPVITDLPHLLLEAPSSPLGVHAPLSDPVPTQVRESSPCEIPSSDISIAATLVDSDVPTTPMRTLKRARSPGDTPEHMKKPCTSRSGSV